MRAPVTSQLMVLNPSRSVRPKPTHHRLRTLVLVELVGNPHEEDVQETGQRVSDNEWPATTGLVNEEDTRQLGQNAEHTREGSEEQSRLSRVADSLRLLDPRAQRERLTA
jgi:hypothetical protein